MTFNWLNFLNLGNSLLASGKGPPLDESKIRTAISRMYYAAFGKLRNHYIDVEKVPFSYRPEDHDTLKREISDKRSPKLANDFHRLRDARNRADYDDKIHGDIIKMAERQLSLTEHVLEKHGLISQ